MSKSANWLFDLETGESTMLWFYSVSVVSLDGWTFLNLWLNSPATSKCCCCTCCRCTMNFVEVFCIFGTSWWQFITYKCKKLINKYQYTNSSQVKLSIMIYSNYQKYHKQYKGSRQKEKTRYFMTSSQKVGR